MSAIRTLSALALGGIVLAGCSGAPAEPAPPAPVADQPPSAPAGPQLVKLGEPFDGPNATYTFTAIEVDPTCTQDYGPVGPAEAGHYVAVEMEVETNPGFDAQQAIARPTSMNFTVVDSEGYTVEAGNINSDVDLCIADRESFDLMAPSSKYRGWVGLDVPEPSGELIFRLGQQNLGYTGGDTGLGWKIAYPGRPVTETAKTEPVPSPETHEYPAYSCDMGADGVPICEGDVPPSVGEYRTPEEATADDSVETVDPNMNVGPDGYCTGTPCGSNGEMPEMTCAELGVEEQFCGPDGTYQP